MSWKEAFTGAVLTGVIAPVLGVSGATAFECPQHFEAAQEQIEKVMADMEGMEAMMSRESMMLVHTLVDDARMLLEGARHNHEKPQGAYDHGRAIAKADAALGYATAADILHFRMMQEMGGESQEGGEMGQMPEQGG